MVYSKKHKKLLKDLVSMAYERELKSELEKLEINFLKLQNGEINAFELDNIIHGYHNRISRELFKKYNVDYSGELLDMTVAYSLKKGVLKRYEIDESLIERIDDIIDTFYK